MSLSSKLTDQQSGSIVVLAAFSLVALLLVIGLAIDAGQLYDVRLNLQKSADAAALAGISSAIFQSDALKGKTAPERRAFLEERAEMIAAHNISQRGIRISSSDGVTAEYTVPDSPKDGSARMTVRMTANVPFLLINRIPAGLLNLKPSGNGLEISVVAAAERPPANIVLLLDISNSMRCLSDSTEDTCACLTPLSSGETCEDISRRTGVPQKIDRLRTAVRTFVDQFDPDFDRISLIPFNIAADTETNDIAAGISSRAAVRFRPYYGDPERPDFGFVRQDIDNALNNLIPRSNTNPSDAFIRGYTEASRVGLVGESDVLYLLVSDGAPTAGRFLFTSAAVTNLQPTPQQSAGAFDYSFYTLFWAPPGQRTSGSDVYPGPSPLVQSVSLPFNHNAPQPPAGAVPACSPSVLESNPERYNGIVSGCLRSLESHLPNHPERTFGANYRPDAAGKPFGRSWTEMFYNNVIQLADFIRSERGIVYTIGVGRPTSIETDPYQFSDSTSAGHEVSEANLLRKDVVLARIANDYSEAVTKRLENQKPVYPEFSYDNYQSYDQLKQEPGFNFSADTAAELDSVFYHAALDSLLRLVR